MGIEPLDYDVLASTALRGPLEVSTSPWSQPSPVPTAVSGTPESRSVHLLETENIRAGLWSCTPGVYRSDHRGYVEFIHVIEGHAKLTADEGEVWRLQPGTVLVIPDGWTGRWEITETIIESFTVIRPT